MSKIYTTDSLLPLIYNELDIIERQAILSQMQHDSQLQAEYLDLLSAIQDLPIASCKPNAKTLENILAYSKI